LVTGRDVECGRRVVERVRSDGGSADFLRASLDDAHSCQRLVVRVNAVAPGPTATDNARAQFTDGGLDAMMRHAPARRVGTPTEIAEVIAYLASDAASFIHGAILPADGGRTAV
jgi:NAD(P)-dependent dehydrogenase (short-subunit alcohol dehydrogenase family)